MSTELVDQLSTWLAATDISFLELSGPDLHLCLKHVQGEVTQVDAADKACAGRVDFPVKAPTVGIYLHTHPLRTQPLALEGQSIAAGQTIGLLQIGALLLPVVAPQAGWMNRHRVASGAMVGYGTVVAELVSDHLE